MDEGLETCLRHHVALQIAPVVKTCDLFFPDANLIRLRKRKSFVPISNRTFSNDLKLTDQRQDQTGN